MADIARQMAAAPRKTDDKGKTDEKPTLLGGLLGSIFAAITFADVSGETEYDEKQGEQVIGKRQKVAIYTLHPYGPKGDAVMDAGFTGNVNRVIFTDGSKSVKVSLPGASMQKATGAMVLGGKADAENFKNEVRTHYFTHRKRVMTDPNAGKLVAGNTAAKRSTMSAEEAAALGL